jgi:hypothetical protein
MVFCLFAFISITTIINLINNATAAISCGVRDNCMRCAGVASQCVWCTAVQFHANGHINATGACVSRALNTCTVGSQRTPDGGSVTTTADVCPRSHQLPCHDASIGDRCSPSVPPELTNPDERAQLIGQEFHGSFSVPSGVRNVLPRYMCVPDSHLAAQGVCMCRNHDELQARAQRDCPPLPTDVLDRVDACAAITTYKRCLLHSLGEKCFVRKFDRVCPALSEERLAEIGCRACALQTDQSSLSLEMLHGAPECTIARPHSEPAAAPLQCAQPLFAGFAFRKKNCGEQAKSASPTGRPKMQQFDVELAEWLQKRIERNSVVLQIGWEHICLAFYSSSSGRFWWMVTQPGNDNVPRGWAVFDPDSELFRAQVLTEVHRKQLASNGRSHVDWILALDFGASVIAGDVSVEQALTQQVPLLDLCRFAAIIAWAPAEQVVVPSSDLQSALVAAMHARGFLFDLDWTQRVRMSSSLPGLSQSLTVFVRRKLATRVQFPEFLKSNTTSNVRWNHRIPFGGTWLRAYVPRNIAWANKSVVMSIHSNPRYVEWRSSVRETWLTRARRHGMLPIFVMCEPTEAAIAEADEYNDIIAIDAPYIYHADRSTLPLMHHAWLQIAVRHAVDAVWVMKSDHDTVVFPDTLRRFLDSQFDGYDLMSQFVYTGLLFEASPIRDEKDKSRVSHELYAPLQYPSFMSGGAGYLSSMALVRCVTAFTSTPAFNYFPREDVGMRLTINEAGCEPLHVVNSDRFHWNVVRRRYFGEAPQQGVGDTITVHYVKTPSMLRQYWSPQLTLMNHTNS